MSQNSATDIFLVRHGETVWHAENQYAGHSDVALTDIGLQQAQQLGRWSETAQLDAIYSSDLSRAIITAQPAATATGIQGVADPRLREVNFGDGEGLTRTEMAQRFGDDLDRWLAAPASRALPGGETGIAAAERAEVALRGIIKRHASQRVLVVAHSTLTRLLICRMLGLDPNSYRRVMPTLGNCAINHLRVSQGADGRLQAALLSFNLPPAGSPAY